MISHSGKDSEIDERHDAHGADTAAAGEAARIEACAAQMRAEVTDFYHPWGVAGFGSVCVVAGTLMLHLSLPIAGLAEAAVGVSSLLLYTGLGKRHRRHALRSLHASQSIEAAGPLAEWLCTSTDWRMRSATVVALIRLLSTVDAADAQAIPWESRKWLHLLLGTQGKAAVQGILPSADDRKLFTELRIAILIALAKIGGAADEPAVRQTARAVAIDKHEIRVKVVAEQCLAVLEARLAPTRAGEALLRASGQHPASREDLLRPVCEASGNSGGQLLRGAGGVDTGSELGHRQPAEQPGEASAEPEPQK